MRKLYAATAGTMLALATTAMTAPQAQAAPLVTGGLVNVTVTDVIDDVTVIVRDVNVSVGAALGIAANVCDTSVNLLAQQLKNGGASCDADASDQRVVISQM